MQAFKYSVVTHNTRHAAIYNFVNIVCSVSSASFHNVYCHNINFSNNLLFVVQCVIIFKVSFSSSISIKLILLYFSPDLVPLLIYSMCFLTAFFLVSYSRILFYLTTGFSLQPGDFAQQQAAQHFQLFQTAMGHGPHILVQNIGQLQQRVQTGRKLQKLTQNK